MCPPGQRSWATRRASASAGATTSFRRRRLRTLTWSSGERPATASPNGGPSGCSSRISDPRRRWSRTWPRCGSGWSSGVSGSARRCRNPVTMRRALRHLSAAWEKTYGATCRPTKLSASNKERASPSAGTGWRVTGGSVFRPDLPAALLPHRVNDVAQARSGIAPVGEHRMLRPIRIAGFDRLNELGVLLHRVGDVVGEGGGVDPPVALHLGLDGLVQREQTGPGRGLDHPPVERLIQVKYLIRVRAFALGHAPQFLIEPPELGPELGAQGGLERRGITRREALNLGEDVEQLGGILACQRGHHGAPTPPGVGDDDVSLLPQPLERGADRRPAHPQPFGRVRLRDARPGRQPPPHDEVPQLDVDFAGTIYVVCAQGPSAWSHVLLIRHARAIRWIRHDLEPPPPFGLM